MTRQEMIAKIIELVGDTGPEHFDFLHDQTDSWLSKALIIIERMP